MWFSEWFSLVDGFLYIISPLTPAVKCAQNLFSKVIEVFNFFQNFQRQSHDSTQLYARICKNMHEMHDAKRCEKNVIPLRIRDLSGGIEKKLNSEQALVSRSDRPGSHWVQLANPPGTIWSCTKDRRE